ncbi:unnamed protein product, partial [Rotaria sordida]
SANALAGAYEYLTKKHDGQNTDVSRLFIYYNARAKNKKSGSVTDSGCSMESAIEALKEFGTCLESIWAYDISKVNIRPNDQAYRDAKNHTISEALEVDINLFEMKSCLAQGYPFAFGLRLCASFEKAAKTGLVPMPNGSENKLKMHNCHALLAVGYSDRSKVFIVRNSWGERWPSLGNNQSYQQNWSTNQFDQQNWSPNQFNQPSQQSWDNNQFYQHNDGNNQLGQEIWSQNQFVQQNWNNSQFSGGNSQFDQQTWTYNQSQQQDWSTNQLDPQSQQHWNGNQFYQPNDGNNSFGQGMSSNNQWNQQNQPQWGNNQYGPSYGGK